MCCKTYYLASLKYKKKNQNKEILLGFTFFLMSRNRAWIPCNTTEFVFLLEFYWWETVHLINLINYFVRILKFLSINTEKKYSRLWFSVYYRDIFALCNTCLSVYTCTLNLPRHTCLREIIWDNVYCPVSFQFTRQQWGETKGQK